MEEDGSHQYWETVGGIANQLLAGELGFPSPAFMIHRKRLWTCFFFLLRLGSSELNISHIFWTCPPDSPGQEAIGHGTFKIA